MEKCLQVFAVSNKHLEVHSPDKLFLQFLKRLEGNAFNVLPLLRYVSFPGHCVWILPDPLFLFSMSPFTRLQVQYRNTPITMKSFFIGWQMLCWEGSPVFWYGTAMDLDPYGSGGILLRVFPPILAP